MDSRVSLRSPPENGTTPPALAGSERSVRLAGTPALAELPASDLRLQALRRACALLEQLEAERRQLDQRLISANRHDPMRVVTGRTSLDDAVDTARDVIRQMDDLLCEAAERARQASRT